MDIRTLLDGQTDPREVLEELSRLGFVEPQKAVEDLRLIAEGVKDSSLIGLLPALIKACSASANPDLCMLGFERVSAAYGDRSGFLGVISSRPDAVKLLAPLFASSRFLVRHIVSDPRDALSWLLAQGRLDGPRERESVVRELLKLCPAGTPVPEAMKRLRQYKYREFLRITVRDLLGRADIAETTLELSNLADASLSAALGVAINELDKKFGPPLFERPGGQKARSPFTVIAMGKLGGRELNFSSDIDIMYLYLADGQTAGPVKVTNHQYFVRLGELVTRLIGEKTEDGFVFRVDLRLRPEGERGDLAQSLPGYEAYYESWGQTWERSALIKARPSAGDMGLGLAFLEMIRPFVYRKYLDYPAIGEIRDMKRRIEKSAARGKGETDLKLGVGGIREIEFFISALQLIYGGRETGIRERNSLKALHRLALKGLVTFAEQGELSRAYEFLRLAEHRLQVVDERQTHSFSGDHGETRALAMRMGYRDTEEVDAAEAFTRELASLTGRVREIYDGLLAEHAVDVTSADPAFDAVLSGEATEAEAARVLAARGFRSPHQAYRDVLLLRDGSPNSPLTPRSRNLFIKILPALVTGCSSSPDPDMAVNNLESFIASFGSREAMYDLIAGKPGAASRITRLFGSSEYFSRLLVAYPEMSDVLLFTVEEGLQKSKEQMAAELDAEMLGAAGFADKMDILRRFKHQEELRIGVRDVFTDPGYGSISRDLTALAEVVLSGALKMAAHDMEAKYGLPKGLPQGGGIAVAGFGKLGACELGYGSDLDIIFVNGKAAGKTSGEKKIGAQEFFARLAERVIFALSSLTKEGSAFRVDTRLRPGGSKGVIAHTLDSLERYYTKSASIWEFQALTRARFVAGDERIGSEFEALRFLLLAKPRDGSTLRAEVKAMRARIERELGRKVKGGYDIKHGKGGLMDVEFAVEYLQLLHGHEHPKLLTAITSDALEKVIALSLVPDGEGRSLKESYGFLRGLESKLRITSSQAMSVLPADESKLAVIAARMGYSGKGPAAAQALLDDYLRRAGRVREIFERIFA